MELFIGNLPANANLGVLIAHFKGFSTKARFRMEKKKRDDGSTLFYAVADFDNDKYAQKFLEKYNGQEFVGRELVIREYFHRSYNNERRAVNWREKPWRAGERRKDDRRLKEKLEQRDEFEDILANSQKEKSLDEQAATIKIEAYANVARKD
jgi:RNA recognition motif-containing protein